MLYHRSNTYGNVGVIFFFRDSFLSKSAAPLFNVSCWPLSCLLSRLRSFILPLPWSILDFVSRHFGCEFEFWYVHFCWYITLTDKSDFFCLTERDEDSTGSVKLKGVLLIVLHIIVSILSLSNSHLGPWRCATDIFCAWLLVVSLFGWCKQLPRYIIFLLNFCI